MENRIKIVYLSAPYSSDLKAEQEGRYNDLLELQGILLEAGVNCVNPLANTVPAAKYMKNMNLGYDDYLKNDLVILDRCDELLVLALPGWTRSEGVKKEIAFALARQLPVTVIEKDEMYKLPNVISGVSLGKSISQLFAIEC